MRLDPAASQLLVACIVLLAMLVLAVWNWLEAEIELRRTRRDLDLALGWVEDTMQSNAVVEMPAPRPLLQIIDGGDR